MDAQATADQRKKSKQEYLEALAKQKTNNGGGSAAAVPPTQPSSISGQSFSVAANAPSSNPPTQAGLTKREQLLEEKRRAFFEGSNPTVTKNDVFKNPEPSTFPTKTETKGLFAPSSNIMDILPPQSQLPKPSAPKPTVADIDNGAIKLTDWKKFGYPSEFAFAKDIGILNDKSKSKPAVVESSQPSAAPVASNFPFGNIPSSNPVTYNPPSATNVPLAAPTNQGFGAFQNPTYNDNFSFNSAATNNNQPQGGAIPSLAFGNIPSNIELAPTSTRPGYAPSSIPPGLLGNRPNTSERKKQQQEQYAKQLNQQVQQQQQQQQSYLPTNTPNPFQAPKVSQPTSNDTGLNIGGGNSNDKDMKRAKQDEYARQLQQQQMINQQGGGGGGIPSNAYQNQGSNPPSYGGYNGNPNGNPYEQPSSSNVNMAGDGGLNIGAVPNDKDTKKAKQAEYARQLQQQQGGSSSSSSSNYPNNANNVPSSQYASHAYPTSNNQEMMIGGGGLAIGSVLDKDTKKAKQAEYARQLQQQQQGASSSSSSNYPNNAMNSNYNSNNNNNNPPPSSNYYPPVNQQEMMIGGGGLAIGAVSDKDTKKAKQAEYARQLQQQQQQSAFPSSSSHPSNNMHAYQPPPQQPLISSEILPGGGGLNIGAVPNDKDAKKAKQAEYARQLQQQQQQTNYQQQQQQPQTVPSNNNYNPTGGNNSQYNAPNDNYHYNSNYQGNQQGNANPYMSSNNNNYNNHNNNFNSFPNPSNGSDPSPMIGGGGLAIGSVVDKDTKKAKQAEYARQLQQQQQQQKVIDKQSGNSNNSNNSNNRNEPVYNNNNNNNNIMGYGNNGGGGYNQHPMNTPGQQQNMYGQQQYPGSNALQVDTYAGGGGDYGGGGGGGFGGGNQPGPSVGGGFQIGNDPLNEKEKKKLQQQEYANALKQQMKGPSSNGTSNHHSRSNYHQSNNNSNAPAAAPAAADLNAGWEIGPLGVPVRKTLNVGNRGVQKAYNNYIGQQNSPNKVPSSSGFGGGGDGGGSGGLFSPNGGMNNGHAGMGGGYNNGMNPSFNNPMYGNNMPDYNANNNNNNLWNAPQMGQGQQGMNPQANMMFGGAGGAPSLQQIPGMPGNILTDFDPSNEDKKKQSKAMEQARLLEEQIRIDKQRRDDEKRKVEEKEMMEQLRIDRQREELAKAFEKEQLQTKQKQHEDLLKKDLAVQMENKSKAKEDDRRKQDEENTKEEARLAKERQEIARREAIERQRDLSLPTQQQQSQQQPPAFAPANNKPNIPNLWGDDYGNGNKAGGNGSNNNKQNGQSLGSLLSGNSRPSTGNAGNGMPSANRQQKTPQIYPSNDFDEQPIVTKFARPNRNANLFQQNTVDETADMVMNQRPPSVSNNNQQRKLNLFDSAPSPTEHQNRPTSRGLFENNTNITPNRRRSKLSYNGNSNAQNNTANNIFPNANENSPVQDQRNQRMNLFDPQPQTQPSQVQGRQNHWNAPTQQRVIEETQYEDGEEEELPVIPSYSTHHNIPPVNNFPTAAALSAAKKVQPNTRIYPVHEQSQLTRDEEDDMQEDSYQVISMQGNRHQVKKAANNANASVISTNNKAKMNEFHYTVEQRGSQFDGTGDLARTLQSDSVFVLPDGRVFSNTKEMNQLRLDTDQDMMKSPAKKSIRSPKRPVSTASSAISSVSSSFQSQLPGQHVYADQERATEEDILQQYEKLFPSSSSSRPGTSQNDQFDIDRELRKNQRKWSLLQKLQDVQGHDASINFTEMWNKQPESARGDGKGGHQQGQDDGRSVWSRGDMLHHSNGSNRPSSAASRPSSSSSRPTSSSNIVKHAGLFALNGQGHKHHPVDDEELYNEYGL